MPKELSDLMLEEISKMSPSEAARYLLGIESRLEVEQERKEAISKSSTEDLEKKLNRLYSDPRAAFGENANQVRELSDELSRRAVSGAKKGATEGMSDFVREVIKSGAAINFHELRTEANLRGYSLSNVEMNDLVNSVYSQEHEKEQAQAVLEKAGIIKDGKLTGAA